MVEKEVRPNEEEDGGVDLERARLKSYMPVACQLLVSRRKENGGVDLERARLGIARRGRE